MGPPPALSVWVPFISRRVSCLQQFLTTASESSSTQIFWQAMKVLSGRLMISLTYFSSHAYSMILEPPIASTDMSASRLRVRMLCQQGVLGHTPPSLITRHPSSIQKAIWRLTPVSMLIRIRTILSFLLRYLVQFHINTSGNRFKNLGWAFTRHDRVPQVLAAFNIFQGTRTFRVIFTLRMVGKCQLPHIAITFDNPSTTRHRWQIEVFMPNNRSLWPFAIFLCWYATKLQLWYQIYYLLNCPSIAWLREAWDVRCAALHLHLHHNSCPDYQ